MDPWVTSPTNLRGSLPGACGDLSLACEPELALDLLSSTVSLFTKPAQPAKENTRHRVYSWGLCLWLAPAALTAGSCPGGKALLLAAPFRTSHNQPSQGPENSPGYNFTAFPALHLLPTQGHLFHRYSSTRWWEAQLSGHLWQGKCLAPRSSHLWPQLARPQLPAGLRGHKVSSV